MIDACKSINYYLVVRIFGLALLLVFISSGCSDAESFDAQIQSEFCNEVSATDGFFNRVNPWTLRAIGIGVQWVNLEDEILRIATRDLLLSVDSENLTYSSSLLNAIKFRCSALSR